MAKTEEPLTVRAEVEALPNVVCPAVKAASAVEPVTFNVPELVVLVKKEEPLTLKAEVLALPKLL